MITFQFLTDDGMVQGGSQCSGNDTKTADLLLCGPIYNHFCASRWVHIPMHFFLTILEYLTRIHELKASVTAKVVVCRSGCDHLSTTQKGFFVNMREKLP